jgi:uncharacterized protein YjbI with pentapeptide repeats
MMAAQTTDAWAETRKIQKEFSGFYKIAGGLMLVVIGIMIGASLFQNNEVYGGSILSQALMIGFAVFVLDQRAEQRRIKDWQERLVMEARSHANDVAKDAVDELRHRKWLKGDNGLLKKEHLRCANLQESRLRDANLQESHLRDANLQGADLRHTNLQDADLGRAYLRAANLWNANLQGADLWRSNLQDANLIRAKLQNATLRSTNLQGVNLEYAEFDENTKLPDGGKWTRDTDMTRFTDPNHPQFWRSDNANSPAYRGKSEDK